MYSKKYDLCRSVLYKSRLYSVTPDEATDPTTGEKSTIFTNIIHGESFFSRALGRNLQKKEVDNYQKLVLSPPGIKNILWPEDFVAVDKERSVEGLVRLDNVYAYGERKRVTAGDYVFLFSSRNCIKSISLEEYLEQLRQRYGSGAADRSEWQNYHNSEIRALARALVEKIYILNREGYMYLDFHPSRLRIVNKEIYLDFSNLIYNMEDIYSGRIPRPTLETLPIEFTEPELYNKQKQIIDYATQNYSLTSILFYLLVGRHAYDGRLRTADIDDSLYNHYIKFENIIKQPIFIFDRQDEANHPQYDTIGEALLKRWETYPKMVKYMFTKVLSRKVEYGKDISYRYQDELPTPRQWINLLNTY